MSNVKEKEAFPLMEKPQPVPGQVPDHQPPPYSCSLGSQFHAYTPVPPLPANSPYPMQIPTTQDAAVYNPMSQVTMNDGKPFPQPGFNTTYAPTTYDPMANLPPVNLESTPNHTVIVSAQSANSARRVTRWRYLKICSVIVTILVSLGVGWRIYTRKQRHKHEVKVKVKDVHREHTHHNSQGNDYDALQPEFIDFLIRENELKWKNNDRHRRMVDVQEIDDSKDYDFIDFNDQPLSDKLFKPQKFSRRRRDLNVKNKFDKKRTKLSTKNKKYYKAKKFIK